MNFSKRSVLVLTVSIAFATYNAQLAHAQMLRDLLRERMMESQPTSNLSQYAQQRPVGGGAAYASTPAAIGYPQQVIAPYMNSAYQPVGLLGGVYGGGVYGAEYGAYGAHYGAYGAHYGAYGAHYGAAAGYDAAHYGDAAGHAATRYGVNQGEDAAHRGEAEGAAAAHYGADRGEDAARRGEAMGDMDRRDGRGFEGRGGGHRR